ncbi:MAG: hypothetical protein E6J91_41915 [Deltaproteobacteria bacterium]|nr:MAG: hypothetical protein E6J91_41915 [Deltaproteobacteria bacterium]
MKTDTGGDVIGIGQPRMQLADDSSLGGLALRTRAGLAIAEDAGWITLWNLATGEVSRRIEPIPELDPLAVTFAISPDAAWLAIGSNSKTRVFSRPFDQIAFTASCSQARAFSHDSKLFVCHGRLPEVWNLSDRKLVAKAPDAALPLRMPKAVQFSTDDRSLYWATDHDLIRWDFATTGATTSVYKSRDEIANAVFSEGSNTAFVSTRPSGSYKRASVLVDLTSGQASASASEYTGAVSSSGKYLIYGAGTEVRVVDAATSKTVWSAKQTSVVQRVAFASDVDLVGFVAGKRLNIVDLPTGPRSYDAPSRFAGWLAEGVVAIERDGKLEQLTLADRTWKPVDRSALAVKTDAPAWASWIAPGGAVAAEPSPRHDVAPDVRSSTPCAAKLRVWTPKGGAKVLAMTCTGAASADPGWEIGGGWAVGVGTRTAIMYDAASGRRVGSLNVERPRIDKAKFAHAFWTMALSPAGNFLALISRGPELPPDGNPDPREDAMHIAESRDKIDCVTNMSGECRMEYFLTLYILAGTPKQAWQARVEHKQGPDERAAQPSSVAFDHSGKHLIVGMSDGEIQVMSTSTAGPKHVERFHHGPILRLIASPGDGWVFSEDAAGQQRLWRLPP